MGKNLNHKNKQNNSSSYVQGAKEAYEGKVALEALKRAGKNQQLKGVVHEVLVKDKLNVNPKNLMTGTRAELAKSANAIRDDIVLKQAGKIVGRMQLKDTPSSISKTVKQVSQGKYSRTTLAGTKETVKAYQAEVAKKASTGVKITQQMKSTGISSKTTERIADKALGRIPKPNTLASAAKSAGVAGALVSAGVTAISKAGDYRKGKITGKEYAKEVIKDGVGGGLSSAAGAGASAVATSAAAAALATVSAPAWVPVAVGVGAAIAVGTGVKKLWDKIWN